jgi:hypothetical protein
MGENRAYMGELSRPRLVPTECSRQVIGGCEGYPTAPRSLWPGQETRTEACDSLKQVNRYKAGTPATQLVRNFIAIRES